MPHDQRLQRYRLLASAIAGRAVEVAPIEPGTLAWTDGVTVFVSEDLDRRAVVESIAVQASLLGAGSLAPEITTKLARRDEVARRYLAMEGHRALAVHEAVLPQAARSLIDPIIAASTSSASDSVRFAESGRAIGAPPPSFGTIRPRAIRAWAAPEPNAAPQGARSVRSRAHDVAAPDADLDDGPALELAPAWVGRGGAVGRLFKRLFGDARNGGTGPPGSDATTRSTHRAGVDAATAATVWGAAARGDDAALVAPRGARYPEWDASRRRYRPDWCTVVEVEAAPRAGDPAAVADARALRRPLARVGLGLERRHRQLQGDEVDLDAAVEAFAARAAGTVNDDAYYVDNVRRAHDLAVLVLLDISGSAGERSATGGNVHEHQVAAAASLTCALHDLGDRVALYGFRSLGRTAVQVTPVKRFDEHLDARALARLGALVPGAYTRLGAAIRHGTATLDEHGGTSHRVLVAISDGFAYDHGYEGEYGEADARRALAEARRRGIGCLCLSIGAATEPDALRRVFGTAAHASLPREAQLRGVIGPLFRAALRAAESQQRNWQRAARTRDRLAIERRPA